MRAMLALALAAWGSWAAGAGTARGADDRKPNILVILADDLGWGETGMQGNPQIPTPHIDSIAKNGIRFTSGYVSGPYCSPTRAGLLIGRYQQRFGHEFNPGPAQAATDNFLLTSQDRTLAERLKEAGYVTGLFGKWHLGYRPESTPLKRGFDEFFGFLGGAHSYLDAKADAFNLILRGTEPVASIDYLTDAIGVEAASFIDRHKGKPWFCYLAFNAVHAPMEAPEKYTKPFTAISDAKRRTYAGMTAAMDEAVGRVLARLRENKLLENTLIVFFSDNGGPTLTTTSSNGPLRGYKAQVWEGGIRVPFAIQWTGHLPAGKVDDRPIIQLDILPTALAAAGVELRPEWKLDGVNLLPYLRGERAEPPHAALFWRFGEQRAVRMGDWKLTDMGEGAQLFNLAQDIGEKENLAAKEPERLKALEAAYKEWNASNVEPRWGKVVRKKKGKN